MRHQPRVEVLTGPGSNNFRGALMALAAMGIFATHDVIVKYLGAIYAPVQIVFFASLLSFPLVMLFIIHDNTGGSLRPNHPGWVGVRAAGAVIAGVSAFYAFSVLPLAQTYAILFATPLIITVLSIPILGEKVRLRRWAAVIFGLVGVIIVLRPGQVPLSLGHLAAVLAAFASALSSIIVRKLGAKERPIILLLSPILGNFFVMGAALPFFYKPMPIAHVGMLGVIAVMGLTATFLVILAYRAAEAVIVAPMQYSQILWATVYGLVFFKERPDLMTMLGAAAVIASGVYIVLRETRAGISDNQPVLETRGRTEMATTPRAGLLQHIKRYGNRTSL
jgi:S-adenosylmethionine uptake transporter